MSYVISLSNFKGGTGKTSTTFNLGFGLANKKKKVLLIDNDPQLNLTQGIGVTDVNQTMHEIYLTEEPINPTVITEQIHLLPSSIELIEVELQLTSFFKREYVLTKKLEAIKDNYDFILIDCPPSLGLLTVNALMASDLFFVPIEPEQYAFNGLNVFNHALDKLEIDIDNIIITKLDSRTNLHNDTTEAIKEYLPGKVFKSQIRKNVKIAEAVVANKDIFSYAPNSHGAEDYKKLTNEVIKLYK